MVSLITQPVSMDPKDSLIVRLTCILLFGRPKSTSSNLFLEIEDLRLLVYVQKVPFKTLNTWNKYDQLRICHV